MPATNYRDQRPALTDLIDYRFLTSDECVTLEVARGETTEQIHIEKDPDEGLHRLLQRRVRRHSQVPQLVRLLLHPPDAAGNARHALRGR